MQNEETTNESEVELQDGQAEVVEETTTEETTEESQSETSEVTPEAELAHAKAEAAKYRRLFEKSRKPTAQTTVPKAPQTASSVSIEETVLLANGMSEDLLGELKAVAAVRKTSLIKAQTDPIFIAVKDKFEKEQRQRDASLPASRSSGTAKPKKTSYRRKPVSRDWSAALRRSGYRLSPV